MNSDLQKAQLTEALLSKDKLRQKMDEVEELAEQRKKELDDLLAGNVPTKQSVEDPAKQNEVSGRSSTSVHDKHLPAEAQDLIAKLESMGIKRETHVYVTQFPPSSPDLRPATSSNQKSNGTKRFLNKVTLKLR